MKCFKYAIHRKDFLKIVSFLVDNVLNRQYNHRRFTNEMRFWKGGDQMIDSFEIKKRLFEIGMSQRKLAKMTGKSIVYINSTINNKRDATISDIQMFCDILNITDPKDKNNLFLLKPSQK